MNKTTLRLGIVGAGMISRDSHLPAALASRQVQVTALIDPTTERARTLARDFGIDVAAAEDITQVIDQIDAAVIATPNASHAEIAICCLSRGKHVLIEKPIATSVSEGEHILAAAKKSGAVLAVGYATRFRDSTKLLKNLRAREYFGKVSQFVNRFGSPGGWSPVSGYNLNKDTAGGGVLIVTGTHFLDRMLHFWGPPSEVSMQHDSKGGPEANCRCQFRFDSGIFGAAIFSKTVSLPAGTVIDTEAGYVMLGEFDDSEIVLRPHDSPDIETVIRRRNVSASSQNPDSFELQMDDFVTACLSAGKPRIGGEEAVESLRLIDRLYQSATPLSDIWYQPETGS